MAEKLVSSWYNLRPVPENYIFPPEERQRKLATDVSSNNVIPVIDLGGGGAEVHDRTSIIQQMLEAAQEFGFFQVINHGMPENLLNDTTEVFKEFFELPPEDKESFYSYDPNKLCRMTTSGVNYEWEDVHQWRDNLRHPCHPVEKYINLWPQKPIKYREHVSKCSTEVRKVAFNILELINEGLGLGYGHLNELNQESLLVANHYPPCPEPSLTLGIRKHADPDLITILTQGDVSGLQVLKDGEWIGVEPLPNALVINIGYQLQIISNGKLKSAVHRAVTNSSKSRTSVAFFIRPSPDCHIEPAKALIDASNPQLYKGFPYKDFHVNYFNKEGEMQTLEAFKFHS